MKRARSVACGAAVAIALSVATAAQQNPVSAFGELIRANERFGISLLKSRSASDPAKNHVISPIPLLLFLEAVNDASVSWQMNQEIAAAFGSQLRDQRIVSRMLLAAFDDQIQRVSMSNVLEYRILPGTDPFKASFLENSHKYFGLVSRTTGPVRPTRDDDFRVTSNVHLDTSWAGNTFTFAKPYRAPFITPSRSVDVEMLTSETSSYRHAKTERFEAIVLPCQNALLTLIVPSREIEVFDLLRELQPSLLDDQLRFEVGTLRMPVVNLRVEQDLRPALESVGIHEIFTDLGMVVNIPRSRIREVIQNVTLQIDRNGIRADATTGIGGIYGGIMSATPSFDMTIDRPFIVLIRDRIAGAILFAGVVLNPTA